MHGIVHFVVGLVEEALEKTIHFIEHIFHSFTKNKKH